MNNAGKKMFIVRKYVMAKDVCHAIKLEKTMKPDDVFIDSDWKEGKSKQLSSAIGFTYDGAEDD